MYSCLIRFGFFWIDISVADAAVANPNGIKVLLPNGFSTFFIKGKPVVSNGPRSLTKNPLDYPMLDIWVFDNFTLPNELLGKALQSLENCLLVNNN